MDPAAVAKMLAVLQAAGVVAFECGEFKVTFGKPSAPRAELVGAVPQAHEPPRMSAAERLAALNNPVVEPS